MQHLEMSRDEDYRLEVIKHMMDQINVIDQSRDDRIRFVWALKLIVEDVGKLDQLDRNYGRLPLPLRPSLIVHWKDAALVQCALREYVENTTEANTKACLTLLESINSYFAGTYQ